MGSFVRRFGSFPSREQATAIEGINIVDATPPGPATGVGTGTVGFVGEFADLGLSVAVDPSTGVISTSVRPTLVTTEQDFLDKFGGFDPTIGDFGVSEGNGFASLANKQFGPLVVAAVNFASDHGARVFRDLPTNVSSGNPSPIVPTAAVSVPAGSEFRSGSNRVRSATRVSFTGLGPYVSGTDGAVTNTGTPAVTQTFNAPGGLFLTQGANGGPVRKGELLVLGVISGAGALGANAAVYRVHQDASSNTALVVEKLSGASFDWTTGSGLPWRIHPASDGDTNSLANSDAPAFSVPVRPLDATISASTSMSPTVPAPAGTATTWNPLSGLTMLSGASALTFTAAVQEPNPPSSSSVDALYTAAIDAFMANQSPMSDVTIMWCSRKSATIRAKLLSHVLAKSAVGRGTTAVIAPELTQQTLSTIVGASDPGVGANRSERVDYAWPGARTLVEAAVGFSIKRADGSTTTDGVLDVSADGWLASILSILPPERNPGQLADPVPSLLSGVIGFQRGVTALQMQDYIVLKGAGVVALNIDSSGKRFQSGVTTSLVSGQTDINRRRFADFIEDSAASIADPFSKLPLTPAMKDDLTGELQNFLDGLHPAENPQAARINDGIVDDKSGNTPSSLAVGIFVEKIAVQMIPDAKYIVLQVSVGTTVQIQR